MLDFKSFNSSLSIKQKTDIKYREELGKYKIGHYMVRTAGKKRPVDERDVFVYA